MATALQSDNEDISATSESDASDGSSNDEDSDVDVEANCQSNVREPCKYYNNNGRCRDGNRCPYPHVCKHALRGNCKYGSQCRLKHPGGAQESSRGTSRASKRSTSTEPKLTDGRYYQWQLNDGCGWKDIENDHVIEAQYCLPHTKSIKIYSTPYGAVSIDFNRMRVYGKSLRVRRLDDGNTMWLWYCLLSRKWIKYGDKDSKGNPTPVKSSDIEQRFKTNTSSSFTFNIGADTFEIRFKEMRQVSNKRKRKVTRRPVYRQSQGGVSQGIQNMTLGTKPQWEFEGSSGNWHIFKHRVGTSTECSVTSDDIERKYQQNPQGSMTFTVKGDSYKLDFRAMTQTNHKTKRTRKVRRVMV
ncbi:uncharacterized protein LOC108889269 isoform X2 [Lates japonicus]